jgi:DNA-directed RNA polymerase beta subunit
VPQASQLFDEATNLIPFLQNNQGNRTMTASRQGTQAVSLHNREQPLVQVLAGGTKTWEKLTGIDWSHSAPVDGKVTGIKKSAENGHAEAIHLQDAAGKKHVQIYNHFPLNDAKTFIHSTPTVKVGDSVKKGQTLADTNFTRNGSLSLGHESSRRVLTLQGVQLRGRHRHLRFRRPEAHFRAPPQEDARGGSGEGRNVQVQVRGLRRYDPRSSPKSRWPS